MMMEKSIATTLLLHLHNLISPLMTSSNKSIIFLISKSKHLHFIISLLISFSVLLLHLIFSFLSPRRLTHRNHGGSGGGASAIARALEQLLSLISEIPVSSRKYDVVFSLAERIINENLAQGSDHLREINCQVLSQGFGSTLDRLRIALLECREESGNGLGLGIGLGRAVRAVRGGCLRSGGGGGGGVVAEKMAVELIWLGEKLEGSGGVKVAVAKWAWASELGRLGLSAGPRVQASLVKLTAFLIKQARDMVKKDQGKGGETEQQKQTNIKMLMTWLPLLCRATNGSDTPTLSTSERGEVERALEEIIDMLEEENKEKVLSLWLNHFTLCPSSDWPNLYGSYIQWCSISRKLLLTG